MPQTGHGAQGTTHPIPVRSCACSAGLIAGGFAGRPAPFCSTHAIENRCTFAANVTFLLATCSGAMRVMAARRWLWLSLLLCLGAGAGCRTPIESSLFTTSGPGWQVQEGQAPLAARPLLPRIGGRNRLRPQLRRPVGHPIYQNSLALGPGPDDTPAVADPVPSSQPEFRRPRPAPHAVCLALPPGRARRRAASAAVPIPA